METQQQTQHNCPHCGASMKVWEHRLTPAITNMLISFARAVKEKGINDIHFQKDIGASANECNNFPKLRYFGLITKVLDEDGTHKQGHWLITRRGGAFLRGEEAVHRSVKTFRNKIQERSEEMVFIWEIKQNYGQEYFQKEFSFNIFQSKLI
jgi:hypothetical protein